MIWKAWPGRAGSPPHGGAGSTYRMGGSRGDVAIFQAFELLRGFRGRCDGGVVDVRVLEEDFHDGVVVNGPDFEVGGDVRGIAGFDEVDFVGSIFMIAAGMRVCGVGLIG